MIEVTRGPGRRRKQLLDDFMGERDDAVNLKMKH